MNEPKSIEGKVSTLFSNLPKYTQEAIAACICFTLAEFRDEVKREIESGFSLYGDILVPAVFDELDAAYNRLTGEK